jgi:hypothetical protein
MALFAQAIVCFCKKIDNNIGFWEKRQYFSRKLAKVADYFDRNIGHRKDVNVHT